MRHGPGRKHNRYANSGSVDYRLRWTTAYPTRSGAFRAYFAGSVVRMLKPEALWVLASTGASVRTSDMPGVIRARTLATNTGSMTVRVARAFRSGSCRPTLAIESQSRRSLESSVASAEYA